MSERLHIYYAHPMSWYGTPEEALDVAALAPFGYVENPNQPYWQKKVEKAILDDTPIMEPFAEEVRYNADAVAYRRFMDGKIGAGVGREILEAKIWGKDIWEIVTKMSGVIVYTKNAAPDFRDILSVEETRARKMKGEL